MESFLDYFKMPDILAVEVFIITVFLITTVLSMIVNRKLKSDFKGVYVHVTHYHKWINRVIFILTLVGAFIIGVLLKNIVGLYFMVISATLIFYLFNGLMQYKYNRETKEYILDILWTAGILTILIGSLMIEPPVASFGETVDDEAALPFDEVRTIDLNDPTQNNHDYATIKDDQLDQLLRILSNLDIQRTRIPSGDESKYYRLIFTYEYPWKNNLVHEISVHDQYLTYHDKHYEIIGDNDLFKMLEDEEFNWSDYRDREDNE